MALSLLLLLRSSVELRLLKGPYHQQQQQQKQQLALW